MKALRGAVAAMALAVCAPAAADDPRLVTELAADAVFGATLHVRFEPGATAPLEIEAGNVFPCDYAFESCDPVTLHLETGAPAVFVGGPDSVVFQGVLSDGEGVECWIEFYGNVVVVDETRAGVDEGAEVYRRASGYVAGHGEGYFFTSLDEVGARPYEPCIWQMYSERLNGTFTTEIGL